MLASRSAVALASLASLAAAVALGAGACGGPYASAPQKLTRHAPPPPMAYPEAAPTEEYEHRADNPEQRVAQAPLSTFSIDVDTDGRGTREPGFQLQHLHFSPRAVMNAIYWDTQRAPLTTDAAGPLRELGRLALTAGARPRGTNGRCGSLLRCSWSCSAASAWQRAGTTRRHRGRGRRCMMRR
jgi:hypothetical protein